MLLSLLMMTNIIYSPFYSELINSYQYQGLTNDCGPFSISIILQALKVSKITGTDLSKDMKGLHWNGIYPNIYRLRNGATFPWGILKILRKYNLHCKYYVFTSEEKIIRYMKEKNIVILLVGKLFPLWAHYMIFGKYSALKGYGFIDPGNNKNKISWIIKDDLKNIWKTYAYSCIVITDII